MAGELLSDLGTEIIIPICAIIGIAFSLVQWVLVSKIKVTPEKSPADNKNGFTESLIEEEEGINDHNVVEKCAEIQNAISEGLVLSLLAPDLVNIVFYLYFLCFICAAMCLSSYILRFRYVWCNSV